MRSRRILLSAIAAVIVVALVLSAVTISVDDPAQAQESAPEPITVPVGKTGDRVVYAHYSQDEFRWTDEFQIGEIVETRDRDAAVVQALEVERFRNQQGGLSAFDTKQLVGLHDRLVATTIWTEDFDGEDYQLTSFWVGTPTLQGLEAQGKTLELGQSVEWHVQAQDGLDWWNVQAGGGGASWSSLPGGLEFWSHGPPRVLPSIAPERPPPSMVQAEVAHVGLLDGVLVYGIHVHAELEDVSSPHDQHHKYLDTVTVDRVYWFSEQAPYPVMVEYRDSEHWSNGEVHERDQQVVLVDYTPGSQPIPWGEEAEQREEPEITQGPGLHPMDGTGDQLVYPLSQAIDDAFGPTGSLEWALWRTLNPDPLLVSASMYTGSLTAFGAASIQWRLVFQGQQDAYEVLVERDPSLLQPNVEGLGESKVPRIEEATQGPRLTISALLDLWYELHPEDSPDFLHWGLVPNNYRGSNVCPFASSGETWSSNPTDPYRSLSMASIGQSTYGPCHQEDHESRFRALVTDIHQPRLMAVLDHRIEMGEYRHESPEHTPTAAHTVTPLPQHPPLIQMGFPDLERGAVIAVPLLVGIFTAYFFPAIQFAATKGLLFIPAFSRIKRSQVLDHKLRDKVHALIRENPAITPTELKKATGVGWGTIVHHLAVMEREGLIASRIEGRHRRFFLADEVPPRERASLAVLANQRTQEIYTDLLDNPGLATPELAQRVGLSSPGALWHLKRLEGSGLVSRRRDGRYVRYYPSQDFRAYDPREAVEVV
jgi:predicted transcriptional regulator